MIPIFKPSIKRKDMEAVLSCMVSDSIGHGQMARRFASSVAEYLGVAGGTAVREYERAIGLAFDAIGLSAGQKVVLTPLSPSDYLRVLQTRGLVPLFAEVDANNGCILPAEVERLKSEEPAALIVANPLGFIPDMNALAEIGIPIIEDITAGIGGTSSERKVGSYGQYAVLSLEAENVITTGGGALVLANGKRELASLRTHTAGLTDSACLPDMNASLGVIQIGAVEQFIQRRKEIARLYSQSLAKTKHKGLIQGGEGDNTWFSFPVMLTTSLKDAVQYARRKGVETIPAFRDTILAKMDGAELPFPNAQALQLRCLLFPLYPTLGKQNIELVTKVISTLP
ncbi:MAG TPA: DegT/DnrJ/EryC1/StrS aminotransferase family protein [Spirochaetia bacterium]|nr:DegT/DnrJ/EryC1/StrS aminotransferase family protein [Spirochaetia bacterium]